MSRVVLIHWGAPEARDRARQLRRDGHTVVRPKLLDAAGLRALARRAPDVIVIDLGRRPSVGRDIAIHLRQRKATREIPVVFVGGEPEKVARIRGLLPDATFVEWRGIRGALRRARPPSRPVVPDAMAGYAGAPLSRKLRIKPGSVVALLGAPPGFERRLPRDARVRRQARGRADVILLFARSRRELVRRLPAAQRAMEERGALWIAWPKKTSGLDSDLSQPIVRKAGLDRGLVDYKVAAIDEVWSGLCFARRRV